MTTRYDVWFVCVCLCWMEDALGNVSAAILWILSGLCIPCLL